MSRIAISVEAFEAIARTLPLASVGYEDKTDEEGEDPRRPLQGPHGPHRQRNPLHHARQYELGSPRHQGRPQRRRARLGARLRIRLRSERCRSSADKAQASMDH